MSRRATGAQPERPRAFDEEGFYSFGDALSRSIPTTSTPGFDFDGRIAEDFKLATGTWVSVGPLRARFIAAFAPLRAGCGDHRPQPRRVAALVFPDIDACRDLPGLPPDASRRSVPIRRSARSFANA